MEGLIYLRGGGGGGGFSISGQKKPFWNEPESAFYGASL